MDKKKERRQKFINICKKVFPWLLGGAAAIGGVLVGFKVSNSIKLDAEACTDDREKEENI